jgi:hypothetical protein
MMVVEVFVRAMSARRQWVANTAQGLLEEEFESGETCKFKGGSTPYGELCDSQRLGAIVVFLKFLRVPLQGDSKTRSQSASSTSLRTLLDVRNAARRLEQRATWSISAETHPECTLTILDFVRELEKKCSTLDDVEDDLKKLFDGRKEP